MEIRYEHRYANKYIKLVCVGKYEDYIKVREIVCHKDESGNIIDDMDLGVTRLNPHIWDCASKSIRWATRLPFSEDEIFRYEKVEEFDSCFKITLNKFQANFFANNGIRTFYWQTTSEILPITIDHYFAVVTAEDLLKILPRR